MELPSVNRISIRGNKSPLSSFLLSDCAIITFRLYPACKKVEKKYDFAKMERTSINDYRDKAWFLVVIQFKICFLIKSPSLRF